jgi:hypothetical protein
MNDARENDAGDMNDAGANDAGDDSLAGDGNLGSNDTTTSDGEAADATGEDGSSAPDAPAPCANLFCEDFEQGNIDPAIWGIETGGGQTVTIDDHVAAHGRYSVHFHVPADANTYGFIITRSAPTALRSHYFGRASFYAAPDLPVGNQQLVIAGNGTFPKLSHFFLSPAALGWMQIVTLTTVAGESETWLHGASLPDARWACMEWEMNDIPGRTTLFVDGKRIDSYDITVTDKSVPFGGFVEFGFGYYAAAPNNGPVVSHPTDIYYDDIALDTERIGCL